MIFAKKNVSLYQTCVIKEMTQINVDIQEGYSATVLLKCFFFCFFISKILVWHVVYLKQAKQIKT